VEFDKTLKGLCDVINGYYAKLFPDLSHTPPFTFSRLMVIIWKLKVLNNLQNELFNSFQLLLTEERYKEKVDVQEDEVMEDLSQPKSILYKFTQAIIDLSINEIKVHMMGSTKFEPEEPYSRLQDLVIMKTKEYYQRIEINKIEILETDIQLIKKIFLPVTIKRIQEIAQEHIIKSIRQFICKKIDIDVHLTLIIVYKYMELFCEYYKVCALL